MEVTFIGHDALVILPVERDSIDYELYPPITFSALKRWFMPHKEVKRWENITLWIIVLIPLIIGYFIADLFIL